VPWPCSTVTVTSVVNVVSDGSNGEHVVVTGTAIELLLVDRVGSPSPTITPVAARAAPVVGRHQNRDSQERHRNSVHRLSPVLLCL